MKISFEILKIKEKNGQSLAEVAIGLTIGAILISAAAFGISYTLRANTNIQKSQSASAFNQELMDKVRALAGANWQTIYSLTKGTSTSYYLNASSASYAVIEGKEGLLDNDVMSGLAGYWKFDEATSTITYDATGNNNTGTLVNGTTRISVGCKIANCMSFSSSSNNYINIPSTAALNFTTNGTFSISLWMSPDTLASTWRRGIIVQENYLTSGYRLGFYNGGQPMFWTTQSGGSLQLNSSQNLALNAWNHLVITYNAQQAYIYLNGVQTGSAAGTYIAGSNPIRFGYTVSEWYSGLMDDVRYYNRALSADEVKRLYNSNVYSRFFNVENVSRDSGGSIVTSGGTNDPSTQKVTASVQWGATGAVTEAKIVDYLTRSKNFVFRQTDWSGGSGQSGVITEPNSKYSTSDNIDILTPGLIKILNL